MLDISTPMLYAYLARRISRARELRDRLHAIRHSGESDHELFQVLEREVNAFSISTVFDKRELCWRRHLVNYKLLGILRFVTAHVRDLVGAPAHRLQQSPGMSP